MAYCYLLVLNVGWAMFRHRAGRQRSSPSVSLDKPRVSLTLTQQQCGQTAEHTAPSRSNFSSRACRQYADRDIMRLRDTSATASTSSWGNLNCICSSQNFALMAGVLSGGLVIGVELLLLGDVLLELGVPMILWHPSLDRRRLDRDVDVTRAARLRAPERRPPRSRLSPALRPRRRRPRRALPPPPRTPPARCRIP